LVQDKAAVLVETSMNFYFAPKLLEADVLRAVTFFQVEIKFVGISPCKVILSEDLHGSDGLRCVIQTVELVEGSQGGFCVLQKGKRLIGQGGCQYAFKNLWYFFNRPNLLDRLQELLNILSLNDFFSEGD